MMQTHNVSTSVIINLYTVLYIIDSTHRHISVCSLCHAPHKRGLCVCADLQPETQLLLCGLFTVLVSDDLQALPCNYLGARFALLTKAIYGDQGAGASRSAKIVTRCPRYEATRDNQLARRYVCTRSSRPIKPHVSVSRLKCWRKQHEFFSLCCVRISPLEGNCPEVLSDHSYISRIWSCALGLIVYLALM